MGPPEIIGCFIPECINTSEDPPGKRFARVPCLPKLRQLWVKAGLRLKVKVPMVDKSPMYCCEDHFNLQSDATKQWLSNDDEQIDTNCFIKLKRGVLPHIFPSRPRLGCAKPVKKRLRSESDGKVSNDATLSKEQTDPNDEVETTLMEILGEVTPDKRTDEDNVSQNENTGLNQPIIEIDENLETNKTVHIFDNENNKTNNQKPKRRRSLDKGRIKSNQQSSKEGQQSEKETADKIIEKLEKQTHKDICESFEKHVQMKCENDTNSNSLGQNHNESVIVKDDPKKRKTEDNGASRTEKGAKNVAMEGELNSSSEIKEHISEKDGNRCRKKRKVVKEILAWIPSSSSVVPQLRSPNPMQPFIVVQTPPLAPGAGPTPVLQFPAVSAPSTEASMAAVPLTSGKETQFILTVPDKGPSLVGPGGQQLVLAVPQGCSFSVDRLSNQPTTRTIPSAVSHVTQDSVNLVSNNESIQASVKPNPQCNSNKVNTNTNFNDGLNTLCHVPSSQTAASVSTPIIPQTIKVGETPCVGSLPAPPCPSCSSSTDPGATQPSPSLDTKRDTSRGEVKLSKSLQQVVDEFRSMKKAIESLNKELNLLRADNDQLKANNMLLVEQTQGGVIYGETKKLELAADSLRHSFTPNQVRILLGRPEDKTRVSWTELEMDSAFNLYCISPHAYKFVLSNLKYPFPSVTTLKRYIEKQGSKVISHQKNNRISDLSHKQEGSNKASERMMWEDYNSEEEVEQDEGAIRQLELQEKLLQSQFNSSSTLAKQNAVNRVRKSSVELERGETIPKVVRVAVQHQAGAKKIISVGQTKKNVINKPNSFLHEFQPGIKPKIVKIQRPPALKNNKINFRNASLELQGIKPIVKEVVRVKKEVIDDNNSAASRVHERNTSNTDLSKSIKNDIVLNNVDNKCERRLSVTSLENLMDKTQILSSNSTQDLLNFNKDSTHEELVISQGYQESTREHLSTDIVNSEGEITIENVPHIIETNDGSKVIRIQVEPLQGEDGTLYEEVVIHCDDPAMFDSEVVGLAFSHDDPMEDAAFL